MTRVDLTDHELLLLDGRCSEDIQAQVEAAAARLQSADEHPELPAALAGFVADAVREARTEGLLVYRNCRISRCPLCGTAAGYHTLKRGPRRGKPDFGRPLTLAGIELAQRFILRGNSVRLGGCVACVDAAAPALREALRHVAAQVPESLRATGAPTRTRHPCRRCLECGWEGHEGEMGQLPTLMGGGTYPGRCPSCGVENLPLGRTYFESRDGFAIVAIRDSEKATP